jgi:hypothetical protein
MLKYREIQDRLRRIGSIILQARPWRIALDLKQIALAEKPLFDTQRAGNCCFFRDEGADTEFCFSPAFLIFFQQSLETEGIFLHYHCKGQWIIVYH